MNLLLTINPQNTLSAKITMGSVAGPTVDAYVPSEGLVAWYLAGDTELDAFGNLTTMYDISPTGGHHLTPTGTPPEIDNSNPSFPVVRWDGSEAMSAASALFTGADPRSIVVVFQADDDTEVMIVAGQNSFELVQNLDKVGVYTNSGVAAEITAAFSADLRWAIASYDGTDSSIETADGVASLTEVIASGSGFALGASFRGSIAEAFVYDHKLTTEEQAALVAYLEDKYSL